MSALGSLMRPGVTADADGAARLRRGRVIVLAGRVEAWRLCRNPLNLTGLAAAVFLMWWNSRREVPQWWVWDVQLDSTVLAFAGPVLVTSQLAVSRVRRDGAGALYGSFPARAANRVLAHLAGLCGPVLLAAAFLGGSAAWLGVLGPVGSPRLSVLAQGPLLVALAGALGVALGVFLPSPAAGLLAVIALGVAEADLLVPFGAPVSPAHGTAWLFPWAQPTVLHWLPGPVSLIPPAAHLAWLAALTVLFAVAAYWRAAPATARSGPMWRERPGGVVTGGVAMLCAAALAVATWSGLAQTRPVPRSAIQALARQVTDPGRSQECLTRAGVRYCAYPGFGNDITRWRQVVDAVLGRIPRRPAKTLVVRQVADTEVGTWLPLGYETAAEFSLADHLMGWFVNGLLSRPRLIPGSSAPPVYVDVNWSTAAGAGNYQFGLATQVAWWLAGLPTTVWHTTVYQATMAGAQYQYEANVSCLPVGQAREAIALWLAASATPQTKAFFSASSGYNGVSSEWVAGPRRGQARWVPAYSDWAGLGYMSGIHYTQRAARLAQEMLALPASRVAAVLSPGWPAWLSPGATDARLAAALGIPLPTEAAQGTLLPGASALVIVGPGMPVGGAGLTSSAAIKAAEPVCQ
jgi:hypothetical protein